MKDEFLTQFLEAPRAEFADALYERISQQPQPRFPGTRAIKLTFRNAAVVFMVMLLVAACVYAVVEEKRPDKVGVIYVDVQRRYNIDIPSPSEMVEEEDLFEYFSSIDEAREILRFRFKVPAWAPDGFTFDEIWVLKDPSPSSSSYAFLNWEGAEKNTPMLLSLVNLELMQFGRADTGFMGRPVVPGSYEEVQVHGQPAVLVRGDWNWEEAPWVHGETSSVEEYEYKWDKKLALQLYWVDGEVMYHLYTRADVSPEDLIKMAESAR
jgi:hypothetical protein